MRFCLNFPGTCKCEDHFSLSSKRVLAYHSFLKKKIKIFKSVKWKQWDVSSDVLVTAIDVKYNFA